MHIVINGSGPMAHELREACDEHKISRSDWEYDLAPTDGMVVVNFGKRSGIKVYRWCTKHGLILIQGTTGQNDIFRNITCPVVLAPNLALPVAYFIEKVAPTMRDMRTLGLTPRLTEEHQRSKRDDSGTAHAIARATGLPRDEIVSLRKGTDPHMDLELVFEGNGMSITTRIQVSGRRLYAEGAIQLAHRIINGNDGGGEFNIQNRLYSMHDFI